MFNKLHIFPTTVYKGSVLHRGVWGCNTTEVQTQMYLSPAPTLLPLPLPFCLLSSYCLPRTTNNYSLCRKPYPLHGHKEGGQKIWLSGQTQPAPPGRFWDLGFLVGLMGLITKLGQSQFPKVRWNFQKIGFVKNYAVIYLPCLATALHCCCCSFCQAYGSWVLPG